MQIYLARDGAEIGEYSRTRLTELAREGQLRPNDYYWHEGMTDWLLLGDLLRPEEWKPLPRVPFYRHRLAVPIAICAAFLVAALLAIILINSGSSGSAAKTTSLGPAPKVAKQESDLEVRDKAAADLKQKIERLPSQATPPLNAFYYDFNINMNKTLDTRAPWMALIAGGENVIDPLTGDTIRRTQFTLTADYHEGEWTYRHYRATATDLTNSTTTEIEDDENAPTPPSIVGMLGLKRDR